MWLPPRDAKSYKKYINRIVTRKGQKLIAIYCMPDHTHVLLGPKPNIASSDLIGDVKTGSTNHINEQRWPLPAELRPYLDNDVMNITLLTELYSRH